MTRQTDLDPSPFFLAGGPAGVLLIHGFTGSPPEMRLIGDFLHQRGFTVSGPLLPGHGTSVEDMNRCRWTDWTEHVESALAELRADCETVFAAGLSLGAVLTMYLAIRHDLPGAVLYSPATWPANRLIYLSPIMKYLIRRVRKSEKRDLTNPEAHLRLWSYDYDPGPAAYELLKLLLWVRPRLPRVTCPTLVIHSTLDRTIHPQSARRTFRRIGASDKELITLHNSGHCLTVDSEWRLVAEKTLDFLLQHLPPDTQVEP